MTQKPKIQYVGQFYVHGSEARQLAMEQERKQERTSQIQSRLQQIEKVYVDPVAIVAIVVSVVMLVTMVIGALQIRDDWAAYQKMSGYVSYLNQQNAQKMQEYRAGYDIEDIRSKALALGMVPVEKLQVRTVTVTIPERQPEPTRVELIRAFLEGMFA